MSKAHLFMNVVLTISSLPHPRGDVRWATVSWFLYLFRFRFDQAHRSSPPDSSFFSSTVFTPTVAASTLTQRQTSGVPGLPVEYPTRTSEVGLRRASMVLFKVPPCAIQPSVRDRFAEKA